jgi:K+-sensing histidine kinase KdpD
MEAGEMPLNLCSNDVSGIVSSALSSLSGLTAQLEVVFEQPEEEMIAFCDPEITRRIMVNLLANAIKFTPTDKSVKISLERRGNMIQASVTDSGPGIPSEAFVSIFEKFGQVHNSQTQANTKYSTGLGLTFCKLAVEAQNGSIGLSSQINQGSTFWFTLPCQKTPA